MSTQKNDKKDCLTMRDQLALSLPLEAIPEIKDRKTLLLFSEKTGIEWSDDDLIKQIEFALKYQAYMRYRFADIMLEQREK